ncbi:MAG: hypothetical protein K6F07_02380 [Bacilli bacterium]|nr:hypothetical protein [Bacilli bacterium]
MVNFFKSFGRGILYVLVLPILAVVLVVYAAISLVVFLFMCFKGLVLFFTGRSLFDDLPEDKQAKAILNATTPKQPNITSDANFAPSNSQVAFNSQPVINPQEYENPAPVDQDPFYVPEYLKAKINQEEALNTTEEPIEQNNISQPEEEHVEEQQQFEYSSDFDDMRKPDEENQEERDNFKEVSISDNLDKEDEYNGL